MSRRDDRDDYDRPRRDEGYRDDRGPSRSRDDAYADDRGRRGDYGERSSRADDDYDRGRGSRRDQDDYDRPRRRGGGGGSGLLIAAAIINLAAGALILLYGILILIDGFRALSQLSLMARFGDPMGVVGRIRFIAILEIVDGFLALGIGGLAVPAGIGLIVKKGFGRTLGLIATFLACGYVLLELIRMILFFGLPGIGSPVVFLVLVLLLAIGLVVFNFVSLFSAAARRSLR